MQTSEYFAGITEDNNVGLQFTQPTKFIQMQPQEAFQLGLALIGFSSVASKKNNNVELVCREELNKLHVIHYQIVEEIKWMGYYTKKYPADLFIIAEIIYETEPDVIIECGTLYGGSALWLAHCMDVNNHGRIMTIDCRHFPDDIPRHPRINYYVGDTVAESTLLDAKDFIGNARRVMVLLDSDHAKEHVLKELNLYAPLVTQGNYLIVEDTNINGHPVLIGCGDGPWEAVHEWLPNHPEFEIDKNCEKYLITYNPNGYLKRK